MALERTRPHDVGTERALVELSRDALPTGAAARLAVLDVPTEPFEVLEIDDG